MKFSILNNLRRMKVAYIIFNLFHKRQLKYNVAAYKALGLKKRYFSPVSSKDFEELKDKKPTINDAENIQQKIEKADSDEKSEADEMIEEGKNEEGERDAVVTED